VIVDEHGTPVKAPVLLDDDELHIVVRALGLDRRVDAGKRNFVNLGRAVDNPNTKLISKMEDRGLVRCVIDGSQAVTTKRYSKRMKIQGKNRIVRYTKKEADKSKLDLCVVILEYGIESAKHTFNDRKRAASTPVA